MKRLIAILLALVLLTGCGARTDAPAAVQEPSAPQATVQEEPVITEVAYESRFSSETLIELSDEGIKTDALSVFASQDIIYYEDRDTYESGNPYGEGGDADKHSAEEAAAHTVVNITAPGAYRITGKLSAGQIRVDLGEDAYEDETAVVELILDNADITCTVAPAILFLNVYECDGDWSEETATAEVDTSAAGANLILAGENRVSGSYVARIYKDKEGEKKLWKQDGAIYSYMSMNVFGPGALELNAENEGLDTELHLTVNGGSTVIRSGNDGINTNEDGVSVTTINGGQLYILAGLDQEGDGIDSNGYLVINGGKVVSAAHPAADAGLDSDLGSFINGGTVLALGSTMDWAESDSGQVTMNLQFASQRAASDAIVITKEDGTEVFSFDPAELGENARRYSGAILSCAEFKQGDTYLVSVGGKQMQYTGTDVMRGPGGFGGFGGGRPPEGFGGEMPEGFEGFGGNMPEGFGGFDGEMPDNAPPEGFDGNMPEGFEGFGGELPEGWTPGETGQWPEGFDGQMPTRPEGERGAGTGEPPAQMPGGAMPEGFSGGSAQQSGEGNTGFYMQDMVNFFSGLTEAE